MVQERTRELLEANQAKDEFLVARDRALIEAEQAHERLSFLAEATRVLVTTWTGMKRSTVSRASWCRAGRLRIDQHDD